MPPAWYSGISGIVGISVSKRAVEYTFVPHPASKPCRLILYQDHLHMICGREEKIIPYGEVVRVQMEKRRGIYITQLECQKLSTITIANHSFLSNGKTENQARQYTLFIRLLHYHLVTKSRAEFSTSTSFRESKRWLFMIVSVTIILALVIDYWNWKLDYITLLLLGVAILTPAVVMVWLGRLPQPYQPSEIPLDFLP